MLLSSYISRFISMAPEANVFDTIIVRSGEEALRRRRLYGQALRHLIAVYQAHRLAADGEGHIFCFLFRRVCDIINN